jgi:UDP-N-acetylglucosamine 2-epimerase (non-hydrolysing)
VIFFNELQIKSGKYFIVVCIGKKMQIILKIWEKFQYAISDIGTISEKSSVLSFPAISLSQSMKRHEAQNTGTIILSGLDTQTLPDSIQLTIEEFKLNGMYGRIPDEYTIENTSWRVLKLIMGNTKLSNLWNAIQ